MCQGKNQVAFHRLALIIGNMKTLFKERQANTGRVCIKEAKEKCRVERAHCSGARVMRASSDAGAKCDE